jgi:periplasmic protein TonB
MAKKKKRSSSATTWVVASAVILLFLALGGFGFYLLSSDSGPRKKTFMAKIDLVKPNLPDKPPPPPKEKLPEQETQQKRETIVTPQNIDQPPEARGTSKGDDRPAADGPLGVQGEGGAGSDGFGLVGRGKGGRDVTTVGTGPAGKIGGTADRGALQRKYGRYNRLVEEEMNNVVKKRLNEQGGIPKGKLEAIVQIGMDESGAVADYRIVRLSGSRPLDEAIRLALKVARISEIPPADIPRSDRGLTIMSIKIVSQG